MNREIKFRGKRVDNGKWIYGNLFVPDRLVKGVYICQTTSSVNFAPGLEDNGQIVDKQTLYEHTKDGCTLGRFIEVIPETVGQYTDTKDVNGKEIYEDDVVNNQAATWVVKFNKGCFCGDRINAPELSYDTLIALRAIGPEKWVLGNTHDNPELLKQ